MKCPICLENTGIILIETHCDSIENEEYKIYLCSNCGVSFANPLKSPCPEWYAKCDYYNEAEELVTTKLNIRFKTFFKLNIPRSGELLDIGCGYGNFIYTAKKSGYNVTGIDFSKQQILKAKEILFLENVYAIGLDEFCENNKDAKYDIITVFGFLEHQSDPNHVIELCRSILKSSKYLAIEVPNELRPIFLKREVWDYPPHHLTRWTSQSLSKLLELKGFKIIDIKDSYLPIEHIYNQVFGIVFKKFLKEVITKIKKMLFIENAAKVEKTDFQELYKKDDRIKHRVGIFNIFFGNLFLRKITVKFIKNFFYVLLLPITISLTLYYRLIKHHGCSIFVLAQLKD
ncbi:MAG: class I SAM-dependent methyltransferase [Elusimicrobia bacterium]|nr:class I SAM-dependent methyltransferase [Elusimicrobiota bacterium]